MNTVSPPSLLETLRQRGFVAQLTDAAAIEAQLAAGPTLLYTGYDPTADSLHVGNLVTLMALHHFARAGHRIVLLLGDATAKIGDPSGKTTQRKMLDAAQIDRHGRGIEAQFARLFTLGAQTQVLRNNAWLGGLGYLDFLRSIGRHFSVNRMLASQAYKQRLERGLSFIELNYQLLQAYDFLQLHRDHGCTLQIGGDDQWGNILAGVDLVRRMHQKTVHGLTVPLLTTASGEKMGKTHDGAIWLDPQRCSPYAFYQYFVNVHDADVQKLLGIFTFLPMPEVRAVAGLQGAELNQAKCILAFEACSIVHGAAAAQQAHEAAQAAFGGQSLDSALLPSSPVRRAAVDAAAPAASLPSHEISAVALDAGLSVVELLVQTKLAASNNVARRLIAQGGVRLDDLKVSDVLHKIGREVFVDQAVLLRAGKKRAVRLTLCG